MQTHADKNSEGRATPAAHGASRTSNSNDSAPFIDNRPEAIAQKKLQAMADASPRVKQLKAHQETADNSARGGRVLIQSTRKPGTSVALNDGDLQSVSARLGARDTNVVQQAGQESEGQKAGYLVDDEQKAESGQMTKTSFLSLLQANVTVVADQELAAIEQTSESCPFIAYWFEYYSKLSAAEVERGAKLFAPSVSDATSATDIISLVTQRVQEGLQQQLAAGTLDPVEDSSPEELTGESGNTDALAPPEKTALGGAIQMKSQSGVIQLGQSKKAPNGKVKMERPPFRGAVKTMRDDAKSMYPSESIHMAHRLSWQSIRDTIQKGTDTDITKMAENLTVPQRDFGNPKKGGVAKGDPRFKKAVEAVAIKYGIRSVQFANALNSSPYNLRPGHGPTNSSIGGDPDAHFDETQLGEPMTPQSASLLSAATKDSSDFMTMDSFADWEDGFYDQYVEPAITSVGKL